MKKEAEKFAKEDEKLKELIETRNKADHILHVTERTIKDLGDKVTEEGWNGDGLSAHCDSAPGG